MSERPSIEWGEKRAKKYCFSGRMSQHPAISSLVKYGSEGEEKLVSAISEFVGEQVMKTKGTFDSMDFTSPGFFCELKRRSSEWSYYDEKIKQDGWLMPSCKVIEGWEQKSRGKRVMFFYFWMQDKTLWAYELKDGDFTQPGSHTIPKYHYDKMLHVKIPEDQWMFCGKLNDVVFEEDLCWISND